VDTFEIACRAVERLELPSQSDAMGAQIVIGVKERAEAYVVVMDVSAARVTLRASRMAGTGGPEGEFDPALAAVVASLAYDLDLHLGVDRRDGEVEARSVVDLAHVPERARLAAISTPNSSASSPSRAISTSRYPASEQTRSPAPTTTAPRPRATIPRRAWS